MEGSSSTSQRCQNDDKFANASSSSSSFVNENGAPGSTSEEGGSVYIDPARDIDIAPCLDFCCGYLPCCCCLYSYVPAAVGGDDDDEWIDYGPGCFRGGEVIMQETEVDGEDGARTSERAMLKVRNAFPVNRNVMLTLIISLLHGIADSLWNGTVLYAYLFIVFGQRNDYIGYMEALMGLSAVLFSFFPVGYLAEKWSKSGTIKIGAFMFVTGAALNTWLVEWVGIDDLTTDHGGIPTFDTSRSQQIFNYYLPLMAVWGFASSIINGPALELYTASIQQKDHPSYFFVYFATYRIASTIGPLVSIIIFSTMGNTWDLETLRVNIFVGMGIELVVGIFCFAYRDAWALEKEDEEEENEEDSDNASGEEEGEERGKKRREVSHTEGEEPVFSNGDLTTPLLPPKEQHEQQQEESRTDADEGLSLPGRSSCNLLCFTLRAEHVPYVLFISSFITAAGGGMTIKFFPLYFIVDVHFTPNAIQGMYVLIPFLQVVSTEIMNSVSSCLGRVQTILFTKILGILFIVMIANGEDWLENKGFPLALLFVLRSVLMNSTLPLEQSVLMDFADDEQCRRWKYLDQCVSAIWAGSSAIGGWLIDQHDYSYTFKITAYLQGGGVFFLLFLLPFVPRQKSAPIDSIDNEGEESISSQLSNEEEDSIGKIL